MITKNTFISLFGILTFATTLGQSESISYRLNGRDISDFSNNPFGKFIGEWTLKNDDWTQNWGSATETIKIPEHHTVTKQLNTDNSLLSIIDGPEPNGHIFWLYNPNTKEVDHLSSFGKIRAGVGKGKIDELGNVELKIVFEGEPKDTYREYKYTWLNADEYHMKSVQYSENGLPTGLFYEGNFIRIKKNKSLRDEIDYILEVLDNNEISKEEQLAVYSDSIIHMAPNHQIISKKENLLTYLKEQRTYGKSDMKHHVIEFSEHGDIILMRGKVEGKFYSNNDEKAIDFKTKNLFVFERIDGTLKISKVIYNISPNN